MDPIAFFDHLAATSQSSNEDEMRITYRVAENQQKTTNNNKQLLNSRSLETIKPVKKEEEEGEEGEEEEEEEEEEAEETDIISTQQNQKSFTSKWHELVASYRLEKEGKINKLINAFLQMLIFHCRSQSTFKRSTNGT